ECAGHRHDLPSFPTRRSSDLTVTGRVTDPGGLAVPGATVTAVNTQTAETATGFTTGDGAYTIPFLKPGIYAVSAELTGFRKVTRSEEHTSELQSRENLVCRLL